LKFRLLYEGPLAPRQRINVGDVHLLRMAVAPQIKALWDFLPLSDARHILRETCPPGDVAILERSNGVLFAPLVTQSNNLRCEIDVLFLRQQAPGQLVGDGGDIDNRLKTLFDALRMPSPSEAHQAGVQSTDENPIHCLLQDDRLVTRVNVETDRLLRPASDQFDLVAIIQVEVKATRATWGNIAISG
jgi:hypothetical protein